MTDDFLWGGINIRKFCMMVFNNFWMVIAVMITAYLGLGFVDQLTYTPSYTSTAVAAVYSTSSSYQFPTIETVPDMASKASDVNTVLNSDMFQSGLHNQYPSLQDCIVDSVQVDNTDLLVMHATSSSPENSFEGIRAALDYYSQFSGYMTGAPAIRIILGPKAPNHAGESSKIQKYRPYLSILSGLMMIGFFLFIYILKKSYKTEGCIRKRYKNVRFFSVPFMKSGSENKKGIFSKKNRPDPIKKLALEIKQLMHKCKKNTLFVTSFADQEGGTALLSDLTKELAEQKEKVLLIGSKVLRHDGSHGLEPSDETKQYTLQDVLQQKCTVKEAIFYSQELEADCIQYKPDNSDEEILYSADDARRVLTDCLGYADLVLVDGAGRHSSHYAHIWEEAADASIALCRQDDADFFNVDQMLNDLQKGDTYFAGCVLLGF